jgi:hypothetical protein
VDNIILEFDYYPNSQLYAAYIFRNLQIQNLKQLYKNGDVLDGEWAYDIKHLYTKNKALGSVHMSDY